MESKKNLNQGCAIGCGIIAFVFIILFIFFTVVDNKAEKIKQKRFEKLTQVEKDSVLKVKQIKTQFSEWDGSHYNLEKTIKQSMNDPGSYEHIETIYWEIKDYLVVLTKYSGKNAFGGRVQGLVKAKVDLQGNVIEIMQNE